MHGDVIVFSTGCPKCEILKKKLNGKCIEYEEVTSVDEMLKAGIDAVPVLYVDDKMLGFKDAVEWVNKH